MAVTKTRRVRLRRHPGAIYVVPGNHAGLIVSGNINLWQQPVNRNPDGSWSSVHSVSWSVQVKVGNRIRQLEVLMPTTFPEGNISSRAALNRFRSSGRQLGMFDTPANANTYADALHNWYLKNKKWFLPSIRNVK